jgi:zinc transport system permease protein
MTDFIGALGQYPFLQNALAAILLASLGCGMVGSYVVVKRIGFLAGGIAHTVLGGVGAALFFGFGATSGALLSAVASALLIGWVSLRRREREDTLIGALWTIGMAAGILFISATPGYNADLMSYLFGNILMVTREDLALMALLDLAMLAIVAGFYHSLLAVSVDEEFARLRGLPVTFLYLLLLCLVAVTVVLLIRVVGLILVIALLTLPAATAGHHVHTLGRMMVFATAIGIAVSTAGLAVSFHYDLPSGATIVLVAAGVYLLSLLLSPVLQGLRTALSRGGRGTSGS